MLDILRFICGNGFWNFVGCFVIIGLVGVILMDGIANIVRCWRKRT